MSSELVLHTIPSHRLGILCPPTPEPYRRIVGMDVGERTLWMAQKGRPARMYDYDPSKAKQEILELPAELALRATVFFETWLASPDPPGLYNCQSFTDFMEGNWQTSSKDFSARSHFLAAKTITAAWAEAPYPLAMGERGVIARVRPARGIRKEHAKACHSFMGLGKESQDCLQVTQMGGFMALNTYDSILSYHRQGYKGRGSIQLYARNARKQLNEPETPVLEAA